MSIEAMQKRLARLHLAQKPNTRLEAEWDALCVGAKDALLARLMRGMGEEMQEVEPLDREACAEFAAVLASGVERAKQIYMRYHR